MKIWHLIGLLFVAESACSPPADKERGQQVEQRQEVASDKPQKRPMEARSSEPDASGAVETISSLSPSDVRRLSARAARGDISANRALWIHYQFADDDVQAERQFRILFAARHPEALAEMSSRILYIARQRDDSDPRKLVELRQGLAMRKQASLARNLPDPYYGPWIEGEIRRLE